MKRLSSVLVILVLLILAACGEDKSDSNKENGNEDNQLKVAIIQQPSTFDPHMTSESIVRDTSVNVYETLITLNADYQPVTMLAESVDESEDGKVYTFKLREGVKFHNGKEMTSEDVLASMNRWKEKSPIARENLDTATFEATDEYTVVLNLEKSRLDTLELLAGQDYAPAIMPKEIIEEAGEEFVSEFIGTGPFKFEEWKQDQYIHLSAFEDYAAVDAPADGLSGKKEALVDDIYFYITKDTSTLLAGLQSGEFDIAGTSIGFNNYEIIKNDPNIDIYSAYFGTMNLVYNKKTGPFKDIKMREAVNIGLNVDDIMLSAFAYEELYKMNSSYINENVKNWYSEEGKEAYNQNDQEKAKQLIEEAGYDGEEIKLLTSRDIQYHYDIAVVVQEQLKQLGMNVKLEVYDWASHLEVRDNPDEWHLSTAGLNFATTPSQLVSLNPNWSGWLDDQKIPELMKSITEADSLEEGKALWDELQGYAWNEYLPLTQFGSVPVLLAARNNVEGLTIMDRPILMPLWNAEIK